MNVRSIKLVMSMIALSLATSGCELIDDHLINDVIQRANDRADQANIESDGPLPGGEVDEPSPPPIQSDTAPCQGHEDCDDAAVCSAVNEACAVEEDEDGNAQVECGGDCVGEHEADPIEPDATLHPDESDPLHDDCELALDSCLNQDHEDEAELSAGPEEPGEPLDAVEWCFETFDTCISANEDEADCHDDSDIPADEPPAEPMIDQGETCHVDLDACLEAWAQDGGEDLTREAQCFDAHHGCLDAQPVPEELPDDPESICDQPLNECMEAIDYDIEDDGDALERGDLCFQIFDECRADHAMPDEAANVTLDFELACERPYDGCLQDAESNTHASACDDEFNQCLVHQALCQDPDMPEDQSHAPPT